MMRRLFGTDGVRGVANDFLTPELALEIGRATASVLVGQKNYKSKVLVGYDTRISSEMLAAALAGGLCSVGADVVILGVVSTPAVAYLVGAYGAQAGVMISASHNSFEFNGIKIFGADGFKLPDDLEEQIESIVLDHTPLPKAAESRRIGRITLAEDAARSYAEYLKSVVPNRFDGLRIALDCANGAASKTAEWLFTSLGAECHVLSDRPDGINVNNKCGSTHMEELSAFVKKNHLDGGAAFDGDADRCLMVDENGEVIDGDMLMAMMALAMKRDGMLRKNTVVGTIMTNFGFSKFCEENGISFIPAKVGDRYVLEALNLEGLSFGGEQSGHIIFRDHATTGDGQMTAAMVFAMMKKENKPLSRLSSVMRRYPQHMVNLKVSPEGKIAFYTDRDIKDIIRETEKEIGDGGRLVIRPSGTEPLIRVMMEGDDEEKVRALTEKTAARIAEKLAAY